MVNVKKFLQFGLSDTTSLASVVVPFTGRLGLLTPIRASVVLTTPKPCRAFVTRNIARCLLPDKAASRIAEVVSLYFAGQSAERHAASFTGDDNRLDVLRVGTASRIPASTPFGFARLRAKQVCLSVVPLGLPFYQSTAYRAGQYLSGASRFIAAGCGAMLLTWMLRRWGEVL